MHENYWLARSVRTILFLSVVLTLAGVYAFFRTPHRGLPRDELSRVVIGVDNGVMPVEQMQVTITKPVEDAVNSVPGLITVRSTTGRGSAEVSLFFDWSVDMSIPCSWSMRRWARYSRRFPRRPRSPPTA